MSEINSLQRALGPDYEALIVLWMTFALLGAWSSFRIPLPTDPTGDTTLTLYVATACFIELREITITCLDEAFLTVV